MRVPYEWNDPTTITAEELSGLIAARETMLATKKQERDAYKASQEASAQPAIGGFNF